MWWIKRSSWCCARVPFLSSRTLGMMGGRLKLVSLQVLDEISATEGFGDAMSAFQRPSSPDPFADEERCLPINKRLEPGEMDPNAGKPRQSQVAEAFGSALVTLGLKSGAKEREDLGTDGMELHVSFEVVSRWKGLQRTSRCPPSSWMPGPSPIRCLATLSSGTPSGFTGAYIDQAGEYRRVLRGSVREERSRGSIHSCKEHTDDAFEAATQRLLQAASSARPRVALMLATHNRVSLWNAVNEMDRLGLARDDPRIHFAQILGMVDNLTWALGLAGYNASKLLVFGQVHEVLPWLLRRTRENRDAFGAQAVEMPVLSREIGRRLWRSKKLALHLEDHRKFRPRNLLRNVRAAALLFFFRLSLENTEAVTAGLRRSATMVTEAPRMTGVMQSDVLKSCRTIEDFLLSYDRESIKLGQRLMLCPEARWFPEEAFEASSLSSRALSEEVKQVVKILGSQSTSGEDASAVASDETEAPPSEAPPTSKEGLEMPSHLVLGWWLCVFSLGVVLGRRGW
eukprot:s246_g22.t1